MARSFLRFTVTLATLALLAACGGDSQDGADGVVGRGMVATFDDLPHPDRSQPFGSVSETDGVITRSYRVAGSTPAAVIDFYRERLEPNGWTPAEPAFREDGPDRADWVNDDYRLEVSATPSDARDDRSTDGGAAVQYSLVLRQRS